MDTKTQQMLLENLNTLLGHAEHQLATVRAGSTAGPMASKEMRKAAAQRKVDKLRAAIARVEAR